MIAKTVSEISETARRSLEGLLGRQLQPEQRVLVMLLSPSETPDDSVGREPLIGLRQVIASAQRNADAKGVSDEEIGAAVEEAMAHFRGRA
ncbi:MAG TPA: hypothetical protein VGY55_14865 [Pirellulales bacterium]|nr:hypothetical protein [Pirellulales bacterium]